MQEGMRTTNTTLSRVGNKLIGRHALEHKVLFLPKTDLLSERDRHKTAAAPTAGNL